MKTTPSYIQPGVYEMASTRFCLDCRHYRLTNLNGHTCVAGIKWVTEVDPVIGNISDHKMIGEAPIDCFESRLGDPGRCGPDARLWSPTNPLKRIPDLINRILIWWSK